MFDWFKRKRSTAKAPENPELLKAMEAVAAKDDSKHRRRLYAAFLNSTLLIPMPGTGPEVPVRKTFDENSLLMVYIGQRPDGDTYLEAYTDLEALRTARPDVHRHVCLPGEAQFQFAQSLDVKHILINRGGPCMGELTRNEIDFLAEGKIPMEDGNSYTIPSNTDHIIGGLKKPPPAHLMEALISRMRELPDIEEAYIYQMLLKGGKPFPVIGLVLSTGKDETSFCRVTDQLAVVVKEQLPPDKFIDWTLFHDGHPALKMVREFERPFYVRGSHE